MFLVLERQWYQNHALCCTALCHHLHTIVAVVILIAHTSQLKCSAAAASPAAVLVMVVARMISLLCQLAY